MNAPTFTDPELPPNTRLFVHDLRNCLASMRAGASMLRRSATQPAIVEKVADGMFDQVQQMLDLVDEFIGRPKVEPDIPSTAPRASTAPLRILIADDNADAAKTLATYLRLSGHRPVVAQGG